MNKSQALDSIERARLAHIYQMEQIKLVLEGKKIEQPTSLSKIQCDVGQWLYNESHNVQSLLGLLFYSELDKTHETWHIEYARIYKIFFSKKEGQGLFSKLFSSSKIDSLEIDKAKLYYAELNETTKKLLALLDKSKRRLSALPESKFS